MNNPEPIDLTALRQIWAERRAAMRTILERFDTRGMTRPARDPDERAWLPTPDDGFQEDEAMGRAARAYYAAKYQR